MTPAAPNRKTSLLIAASLVLAAGLIPLAAPAGAGSRDGDQQRIRRLVRTHLALPRQSYSGGLRGWLNPPDPSDVELAPSTRIPALGTNVDANDPMLDLDFTAGKRTYYIWTDGRLGVPQPFVDTST